MLPLVNVCSVALQVSVLKEKRAAILLPRALIFFHSGVNLWLVSRSPHDTFKERALGGDG